ncbi:LysR family transcriptional regulator [Robbsia andropogonis]|uniref:LysR family transcriptional regulator n=1 Tax=Robbsia andropogonis TaxID=28092 RepID=UPI000462FA6F|nr:LysR family transcriptional regulator [Robbsia andropogonis]
MSRRDIHTSRPILATDRIEIMQTFVRIVEAGSLSAAAAQLGTTQPTVSRRLQWLEKTFGVRLLQRTTHAMKLTDDGERCYDRAKQLLADWATFEADVRGADAEPAGLLRVIAPHAFGQQRFIPGLARFMQRYPHVQIEWLLHDRAADFIAEGVDCAIHIGELHDPSLVAILVAHVPRIIVAAPAVLAGHPIPQDPEALTALPWLSLQQFYRKDLTLTHALTGATRQITFRPRMTTDSLYAVRSAALEGLGVCVASSWVVGEDIAVGALVQLAPQWQAAPLPVYLVYPYARFYPAKLRRFTEMMRESITHQIDDPDRTGLYSPLTPPTRVIRKPDRT